MLLITTTAIAILLMAYFAVKCAGLKLTSRHKDGQIEILLRLLKDKG